MVWQAVPGPERRRVALVLVGSIAAALAVMTAARWAYYGELVPNTYALKLGGVPLWLRLERGILTALKLAPALGLASVGGLVLWRERGSDAMRKSRIVLLAATGLGAVAYSVYVGGDAWEYVPNRYVAPFLASAAVLALTGLETSKGEPRGFRRPVWAAGLLGLFGVGMATIEVAWSWRLGVLGASVAVVLLWLLLPSAAARRCPALPVALAAAAMLLATSGIGFLSWALLGGHHVEADQRMVEEGRALARATDPAARIAVVWAGAPVYYAQRPAVDLLGKSDRVVASGPRRGSFWPGHDKWDYDYSIHTLRPDVIHQLWMATPEEWAAIRAAGYEVYFLEEAHGARQRVLVRSDSALVDRRALETC